MSHLTEQNAKAKAWAERKDYSFIYLRESSDVFIYLPSSQSKKIRVMLYTNSLQLGFFAKPGTSAKYIEAHKDALTAELQPLIDEFVALMAR